MIGPTANSLPESFPQKTAVSNEKTVTATAPPPAPSTSANSIVAQLMAVIEDRKRNPPPKSYTTTLLNGGIPKIGLPAMGLIAGIYALTFVASMAADTFKA